MSGLCRPMTYEEAREAVDGARPGDLDCDWCGYEGMDPGDGAIWTHDEGYAYCSKGCAEKGAAREDAREAQRVAAEARRIVERGQ